MENRTIAEMTGRINERNRQGILTLEDCADFLNEMPRFTQKHVLADTRKFLDFMGAPDEQMQILHIAGTNGKGSVCAYLSSILMHAGYTTGMFSSPHLVRISERFRINDAIIEDKVFIHYFMLVLYQISQYEDQNYFPTFFEYLFFMAMLLYHEHPVDYLILETGMGGRLDATNSIRYPKVCTITEIGMDHMQYLGNTIEEIAGEKAGIIKEHIPVVYCDRRTESSGVIEKRAMQEHAQSYAVSGAQISGVTFSTSSEGNKCIDFSYHSRYDKYVDLRLSTTAKYQTENAALAITTIEVLREQGVQISQEAIRRGLTDMTWEARMEEAKPDFYIDGAHNADGIAAFLESVRNIDCSGQRHLIFGVVGDKQYENMAEQVLCSGLFADIAVTVLATERSVSETELEQTFYNEERLLQKQQKTAFFDNAAKALKWTMQNKKTGDMVFTAGSLYLAGQIKAELSSKI